MAAAVLKIIYTDLKAEDKLAEEERQIDEAARDLGFSIVPNLLVLDESIISQLSNLRHLYL